MPRTKQALGAFRPSSTCKCFTFGLSQCRTCSCVQADTGWHKPIQDNEKRWFPDGALVSSQPVCPALQRYILSQASPSPPEPGKGRLAKAVQPFGDASAAGTGGSAPMPPVPFKAAQPVARCWAGELSLAGWQHADAGSTVRHHCNRRVHMHMMYLFCNVVLRFATGSRSPQFNRRCVI